MAISFLTPILLAGAALVAIPIIIHLIMRRKPKHLMFPAFRFLRQKQRTTVQKLRLRHLLLLALRVMLILIAVMALAGPELSGGPDTISPESALGVVMVFDTSASMGYIHNDKSRLDEAKEQAEKFLKKLPDNSKVAVFDTGETGTQIIEPAEAINRIRALNVHPYNRPVTDSLREVLQFLDRDRNEQIKNPNADKSITDLPLMVCVFSDRTEASWDGEAARDLTPRLRDFESKLGTAVTGIYLDMSPEKPRNLAIVGVAVKQVQGDVAREIPIEKLEYGVAREQPIQIQAQVRVTGMKLTGAKLLLFVEGVEHDSQSIQIEVPPGENRVLTVTFSKAIDPKRAYFQGEVRLQVNDALKADDVRYWTLSAPQRSVLLVTDKEKKSDAFYWDAALEAQSKVKLMPMKTKIVPLDEFPADLSPEDYQTVCLINVENPGDQRWKQLHDYVTRGGGLIILPGENSKPAAYNTDAAMQLMPAKLKAIKNLVKRQSFDPANSRHEIVQQFKKWELPLGDPQIWARRIWELEGLTNDIAETVVPYEGEFGPAIVERIFPEPDKAAGKVLLFTTAMYARDGMNPWNNYLQSPVYLSLVYVTTRYTLGQRDERQNYGLKEDLRFGLPKLSGLDAYELSGPDGGGGKINDAGGDLVLTEGRLPGNYKLTETAGKKTRALWSRYFSVNLPPVETQLVDPRPSVGMIEELLGDKAVSPLGTVDLSILTASRIRQAPKLDLLPYLMILALVILIGEGLLANRFYKQEPQEAAAQAA